MNNLTHIKTYYFIGIGGIGMSALARFFRAEGKRVCGYDKTPSAVTGALEDLGIVIHFEDTLESIPKDLDKEETLVVYTPAVPQSHKAYTYLKEKGFTIKKRAEVLGMLTQDKFCLAVAGTHGKTTTTAILGHLLAATRAPMTAFVGGMTENYNSNLIQKGNDVIVVEADEFDRSFLQLFPNIACITSMDADHLDIYGDASALEESFREFADHVQEHGTLFVKHGLDLKGKTVGIGDDADFSAINIRVADGGYLFDLKTPEETIKHFKFNLPGRHNLFNAVAALAMTITYGSPIQGLGAALSSFKGVNRRFTYRIKRDDLVLIDDYAHHPAEIDAVHDTVREMYPDKEVLAIFQPHLFSRTRDFMDDFAKSLSRFDAVVLLDIYPAREEPIAGIDSAALLEKIKLSRLPAGLGTGKHADSGIGKQLSEKNALAQIIKDFGYPVVVMLGAGDIGEEILKITKELSR